MTMMIHCHKIFIQHYIRGAIPPRSGGAQARLPRRGTALEILLEASRWPTSRRRRRHIQHSAC